jgi:hypothetical protein
MNEMRSARPFARTASRAVVMMPDGSIAYTRRAPARQASMLRMPVPAPTSATTEPWRTTALMACS